MSGKAIPIEGDPITIRKRKHDEMESDDEETSQIVKIARTSDAEASSSVATEDAVTKTLICPSGCKHLHAHPQYESSIASMRTIRTHLSEITVKNRNIKVTMQTMRESVVDELLSHMRVRQLAIGQIGRSDLEDDMRELCLGVLERRKGYMGEKEKELVNLEKLLGGYDAMLELANAACVELDEMISSRMETIELGGSWGPLRAAMPHMIRLAKYTIITEDESKITSTQRELAGIPLETQDIPRNQPQGEFAYFSKLPVELRAQIWRSALPSPRILTANSHHNRHIAILGVCHESRQVVESYYTRILSPTKAFPQTCTPIIYAHLSQDIIIRDLTIRDTPDRALFSLESTEFLTSCHHMLSGLSQIKHLALAYDILRENGGTLFRSVQVCCPLLETLIVFPNAQLISSTRRSNQNLKFIDVDSNLLDYTSFRQHNLPDRETKAKAMRGMAVLATLYSHSLQYKSVFREYVEAYGGREWNPVIRVCLLARWNRAVKGWQTRSLVGLGDRCSRGFEGEDGRMHKGFVEAGMVCGEDGEGLSRYDGVERLFWEEGEGQVRGGERFDC